MGLLGGLFGSGFGGGAFPLKAPAPMGGGVIGGAPGAMPMAPIPTPPPALPNVGTGPGFMPSTYMGPQNVPLNVGTPAPLQAIMQAEGTSPARAAAAGYASPYDVPLGYGQYGNPSKPLSQMTLGEAYDYGRDILKGHGSSSAKGAFQITNRTMKDFMDEADLTWDDPFNEANQNRLAYEIWKQQGTGAWEGFKGQPGLRKAANTGFQQISNPSALSSGDNPLFAAAPPPDPLPMAQAWDTSTPAPTMVADASPPVEYPTIKPSDRMAIAGVGSGLEGIFPWQRPTQASVSGTALPPPQPRGASGSIAYNPNLMPSQPSPAPHYTPSYADTSGSLSAPQQMFAPIPVPPPIAPEMPPLPERNPLGGSLPPPPDRNPLLTRNTYALQAGENPWEVSRRLGIPFQTLMNLNPMTSAQARRLPVGYELQIPGGY